MEEKTKDGSADAKRVPEADPDEMDGYDYDEDIPPMPRRAPKGGA